MSYFSSSATSILACSCLQSSCRGQARAVLRLALPRPRPAPPLALPADGETEAGRQAPALRPWSWGCAAEHSAPPGSSASPSPAGSPPSPAPWPQSAASRSAGGGGRAAGGGEGPCGGRPAPLPRRSPPTPGGTHLQVLSAGRDGPVALLQGGREAGSEPPARTPAQAPRHRPRPPHAQHTARACSGQLGLVLPRGACGWGEEAAPGGLGEGWGPCRAGTGCSNPREAISGVTEPKPHFPATGAASSGAPLSAGWAGLPSWASKRRPLTYPERGSRPRCSTPKETLTSSLSQEGGGGGWGREERG